MADKKSFHPKENGGAFKAMRRTLGAGVTATVVLSAALSVAFAIVLDGCSGKKSNKTEVSSSNTNSSSREAVPTPSPIGYVKPVKETHKKKIVHAATLSYNDSLSGVSFRYPREYKLTTPDNSKPGGGMTERAPMNFALPGGLPVATIELPKGPATSFFEVNVNKGLTQEQCGDFADPDLPQSRSLSSVSTDEGSIPVKVSLGGVDFTKVENGTQELDTRYYHRYDRGACYEFVMGVTEKPGNTSPWTTGSCSTRWSRSWQRSRSSLMFLLQWPACRSLQTNNGNPRERRDAVTLRAGFPSGNPA